MKNKIKNIYYCLILGILIPSKFVFADKNTGDTVQPAVGEAKLTNPIGTNSIQVLVDRILDIIIAIGTPIAVLFMIYAGFKFVWARGKPAELEDARKTLMWTIVGIVILLGAELLSNVVSGTITQLGSGL